MSVSAPEEENSQKKNIRFGLLKDKLKNRRRIGAMAGRWPDYSYERDREMDDLPLLHRDPFDRMLLAQAKAEGFKIVSHDNRFLAYGDFVIAV